MSVGVCVRYHDPLREETYWPYLTQLHLNNYVWPLASANGWERVELLEVLDDYQTVENVRALLTELDAVCLHFGDPATVSGRYPEWEHVQTRTMELIQRLQQTVAEWADVQEVLFF